MKTDITAERKKSWRKILEETVRNERSNVIFPTIEWLISKGCDKIFYISFSHYDLFLTRDCRVGRTSDDMIVFGFK